VTWLIDIAVMAVVGGLIGWFTNYLAVKMLFRPFKPWRIPLTKFELQGLIPKRRAEIAASIGVTIEKELISVKELVSRLIEGENKQELIRTIRVKILTVIDERIPSIIPGGIKQAILSKLRDILNKEITDFVDNSMGDMIEDSIRKIDISNMVEEQINSFELEEIERLILEISGRELKYIELLGGVLGAAIGLIQGLVLMLF
jgi:uncharacterized membrane protein YheB (UPF0754 family)